MPDHDHDHLSASAVQDERSASQPLTWCPSAISHSVETLVRRLSVPPITRRRDIRHLYSRTNLYHEDDDERSREFFLNLQTHSPAALTRALRWQVDRRGASQPRAKDNNQRVGANHL